MAPLVIASFVLLPLTYAFADRFGGGWFPALDKKLPGRAVFWGALLAAGVGFGLAGINGALFGLVWLIYRSPGWRIFGGSATPLDAREIAGTFLRHLIAVPLALGVAYWRGLSLPIAGAAFAVFAVLALGLAMWFGNVNEEAAQSGDHDAADRTNFIVELARGAAFGLAVAGAIAL